MAKKRPTDRKLATDERVPIPAHLRPRPALRYELDKKPERRVLWVLRSLTPGLNYLTNVDFHATGSTQGGQANS